MCDSDDDDDVEDCDELGESCKDLWVSASNQASICYEEVCNQICDEEDYDWCEPEWDSDDFEDGEEGECEGLYKDYADEIADALHAKCEADEDRCEKTIGEYCKAAWDADDKYVHAACIQYGCDEACKKTKFDWCPGMSIGTLIAIIVPCVVVGLGGAAAAVVVFIKKKAGSGSDAGA
jgi:hypothetical protein